MGHEILVTGGTGFIGSWMTSALLDAGHQVTVLDDLSTTTKDHLPLSPNLHFVQGSVLDASVVREVSAGADFIYHLAGITGMRLAHTMKQRAYNIAVEGTATLLANSPKTSRLMLASSSAVYGLTSSGPVPEDRPLSEESVRAYDGGELGYAAGKWRLEDMGKEAASAGRDVLIVRPFNVVGPRQSPNYGMVLPTFIKRALMGEDLVVYNDGKQTRSFCDVRTFCEVVIGLCETQRAWTSPPQLVNIGNPHQVSIQTLAEMVIAATHSRSKIVYRPYGEVFPGRKDVQYRIPDTRLLHLLYGQPKWKDLNTIVRESIEITLNLQP